MTEFNIFLKNVTVRKTGGGYYLNVPKSVIDANQMLNREIPLVVIHLGPLKPKKGGDPHPV